jgi:hypothetical protein
VAGSQGTRAGHVLTALQRGRGRPYVGKRVSESRYSSLGPLWVLSASSGLLDTLSGGQLCGIQALDSREHESLGGQVVFWAQSLGSSTWARYIRTYRVMSPWGGCPQGECAGSGPWYDRVAAYIPVPSEVTGEVVVNCDLLGTAVLGGNVRSPGVPQGGC